jgi:hypothetical protein
MGVSFGILTAFLAGRVVVWSSGHLVVWSSRGV